MKRVLSMLTALSVFLVSFSFISSAKSIFAGEDVTKGLLSEAYFLQSLDDDTVFFEKNADKKMPAAAFIKLIGAAVAIEKWGSLDDKVTVTEENLSLMKYDYGIRTASFEAGEKVKKSEILNSLVVYSANDAASIIAHNISGSVDAFVAEMQALTDKIGCSSTVIKNIHGFDEEGQYTTARDVALFMKYALNYPAFSEAVSADSITLSATDKNEERVYYSSNKMKKATIADYYHDAVTAGKYTATEDAGECAVIITNKDGYSYLAVTMGGVLKDIDKDGIEENSCFTDVKKMLNWVYENIRYRVVASPEQSSIAVVDVIAGKDTDKVRLVPEKEISALVPSGVTPASVMIEIVEGSVSEEIVAPVKAGEVLGQAKVYYAGVELATMNVVAATEVERSFFGLIMSKISALVGSTAFMILTIILFLACAGYLVYMLLGFYGQNVSGGKKSTASKRPVKASGNAAVRKNGKAPLNKTKAPAKKSGKAAPVKKASPKNKSSK